jgi:hypothetical protein
MLNDREETAVLQLRIGEEVLHCVHRRDGHPQGLPRCHDLLLAMFREPRRDKLVELLRVFDSQTIVHDDIGVYGVWLVHKQGDCPSWGGEGGDEMDIPLATREDVDGIEVRLSGVPASAFGAEHGVDQIIQFQVPGNDIRHRHIDSMSRLPARQT